MQHRTKRFVVWTGGFTLVEVLMGLTLMALLAVMGWRGIDTLAKAKEQTQSRLDQVAAVQTALMQWRYDLNANQAMEGPNPTAALVWDGQTMKIIRRANTPSLQGLEQGLVIVCWAVHDGHWWRWQSSLLRNRADREVAWSQALSWSQSQGREFAQGAVKLMPVNGWRIVYFRGNAWTHPLSSDGTPATDSVKLPDGVRVVLQLDQDRSNQTGSASSMDATQMHLLTMDWIRPDFTPSSNL